MLRRGALLLGRASAVRVGDATGKRQLMVASPSVIEKVQAMASSDPHLTCLKMVTDGADPVLFTYKDFEKNINAMAHGVQRTLFTPKHKIVIWAKDCAENVVAQLGAAKGGVQVQVLGAGASAAELEKALSDARALLFSPTLLPEEGAYKMVKKLIPELEGLPEENGGGDILYSAKFPDLRWVFNTGFERYPGMIKFAYVLNPIRQAPAVTKPGTITFTGPGDSKSLSVPHLDPDAKMPFVEPSNEIA